MDNFEISVFVVAVVDGVDNKVDGVAGVDEIDADAEGGGKKDSRI